MSVTDPRCLSELEAISLVEHPLLKCQQPADSEVQEQGQKYPAMTTFLLLLSVLLPC